MRTLPARTRLAIVFALALFALACAGIRAADMDLTLAAVPVDNAAAITGVQLVRGADTELLATTKGTLSIVATADGRSQLAPTMPLDSGSTWEAHRADDELTVLYTQAGSAVSWAMSKSTRFPAGAPIHDDTFAVYLQPRFARAAAAGATAITAVRLRQGTAQVIYFSYDGVNRRNIVREIGKPAVSILDARLVRDATGYWLFTLVQAPDEVTAPARGARRATVLTAERLDDSLKPRGNPIRVFANRPVYEFDVQPAADGEVAIIATTPAGAIYARGRLADTPLAADRWKETPFAAPLSSPSLLVSNGAAHVAALERAGEPNARILRGRVE